MVDKKTEKYGMIAYAPGIKGTKVIIVQGSSAETDSGIVKIGDVAIDTTWNGKTQINF